MYNTKEERIAIGKDVYQRKMTAEEPAGDTAPPPHPSLTTAGNICNRSMPRPRGDVRRLRRQASPGRAVLRQRAHQVLRRGKAFIRLGLPDAQGIPGEVFRGWTAAQEAEQGRPKEEGEDNQGGKSQEGIET